MAQGKPKPNAVDLIIVDRLLQIYDPFEVLFDGPIPSNWRNCEPRAFVPYGVRPSTFNPDARAKTWHAGRVRAIVEQAESDGAISDPIEVDNEWKYGSFARVVLLDGHHRFCAAVLVGLDTIPVSYSGRTDILEWLRGDSGVYPPDDL